MYNNLFRIDFLNISGFSKTFLNIQGDFLIWRIRRFSALEEVTDLKFCTRP